MAHRKPGLLLISLLLLLALPLPPAATDDPPQPRPEVQALLDQGLKAKEAGKSEEALRLFNEAREKAHAVHDGVGEVEGLSGLGDKKGEAAALENIGIVYAEIRQPQKALQYYEQALLLYRALGDRGGEAGTLTNIGLVYADIGQPMKALEYYEQALPLARAVGNRAFQANTLTNIGIVHANIGQPMKALEYYEQALPLHRAVGNRAFEANTLYNIGSVYDDIGQPQKALEYYEQALALYRALGDRGGEADTLTNIGVVYRTIGQPQKALQYYEQALPLHRAVSNRVSEAKTLCNIGNVYRDIGPPQKALEYYEQALLLRRTTRDRGGEAGTLNNIGIVYAGIGQPQKALEYFEQALPLHRAVGNRVSEAKTLYNIGIVYAGIGQPQKALQYYEQALSLARAVGSQESEANTLTNIGNVYAGISQPQKALQYYEQALPLHRAVSNRVSEAKTLNNISALERSQGRLEAAGRHLQAALTLLEGIRSSLGGLSEAKGRFLAAYLEPYHAYIDLLLQRHQEADAFAWAQKTKARALLDLLYDGRVAIQTSMTDAEKEQEAALRQRADQLNAQMVAEGVRNQVGSKQRFAALKGDLARAESELQQFTDRLYARHPDLAHKRAARTTTLADLAGFLPADTALLEYVVLEAGAGRQKTDRTILLVVTAERGRAKVCAYPIRVRRRELGEQVDAFRSACADPRRDYRPRASQLYRLLIAPAARQLAGKRRLIVCPDGPLWDLPFAALLVRSRPAGRRARSGRALRRPIDAPARGRRPIDAPSRGAAPGPRVANRGVSRPRSCFLIERFEIDYAYSATGAQAALHSANERRKRAGSGISPPEARASLLVLANPTFGDEKRFGDNPQIAGQRPIDAPGRPIEAPARPIDAPGRLIEAPGRAIEALARALCAPRGARLQPLPGTQREAEALKKEFPGAAVYTREQAQESLAKAQAGRYRYLHFATHGFFNDAAPLLSSIVLAEPTPGFGEDGFLTAREIFDLNLTADMVVLSACNTARGEQRRGEGIVGLAWALFVAGAPAQVLSQWSVDDASTATLMKRFYGRMSRGQAKGAALRQAELAQLRDGRHGHPYFWAPFVLTGDWR
jgi:CHAT domain-containing protein/tetratricopeptide (TPR) repeat protein